MLSFLVHHARAIGVILISLGIASGILCFCATPDTHTRWFAGLFAIALTFLGVEVLLGFDNI
jgi:hypothetical protein